MRFIPTYTWLYIILTITLYNSISALRYEETCLLVQDYSTHEHYIEINGHRFDIIWVNFAEDSIGCKAALHNMEKQ